MCVLYWTQNIKFLLSQVGHFCSKWNHWYRRVSFPLSHHCSEISLGSIDLQRMKATDLGDRGRRFQDWHLASRFLSNAKYSSGQGIPGRTPISILIILSSDYRQDAVIWILRYSNCSDCVWQWRNEYKFCCVETHDPRRITCQFSQPTFLIIIRLMGSNARLRLCPNKF
jgi:hypothetical protein